MKFGFFLFFLLHNSAHGFLSSDCIRLVRATENILSPRSPRFERVVERAKFVLSALPPLSRRRILRELEERRSILGIGDVGCCAALP